MTTQRLTVASASAAVGSAAPKDTTHLAADRALMASFLVALYIAGPTLGLIAMGLPHVDDMNELGVIAAATGGYLVGGTVHLLRRMLPIWGFEIAALCGTVLISVAIYYSGSATTTFAFFYLWVMVYAAYFFDRRRAALQLAWMAGCYAGVLVLKPSVPGPMEAWVIAVGTLAMAGILFAIMRDRVTSLVARLAEAADTDPLTQLLNRRGFNKRFELELERAERGTTAFGLIVGDLDHFKQVNDHFGHQVGDQVLESAAGVLRAQARRIDTVARVGGEEFALLLPSADSQGAFVFAERLRAAMRDALANTGHGLTISFGVTSYPKDGRSVEQLLRYADESLYAAKTLGRDRTVIYSAEVVGALAARSSAELGAVASNLTTLLTLAEALDIRDPRTADHSATVGRYAEAVANQLGVRPAGVERIRLAGVLHDIGKIGVSDSILYKPGPLEEREWDEIRKHPEIGARLLSAPGLEDLRAWVLAHHERPDGTGYPLGLRGDEIPLEARIIAVADAFEAMLADRPYRAGMSLEAALTELRVNSGTQFDADVVAALIAALPTTPAPDRVADRSSP